MRRVIVLGSLLGFRPHPDDLMDSRFDGIKGGEKCNPSAKQVKAFFKKHGLEDRIEELVKWTKKTGIEIDADTVRTYFWEHRKAPSCDKTLELLNFSPGIPAAELTDMIKQLRVVLV